MDLAATFQASSWCTVLLLQTSKSQMNVNGRERHKRKVREAQYVPREIEEPVEVEVPFGGDLSFTMVPTI